MDRLENPDGTLDTLKTVSEAQRWLRAHAAFERAHGEDPTHLVVEGRTVPRSLDYHRRLLRWVDELEPSAPEVVRLAAACQHVRRWLIGRDEFPPGPAGYKRWRARLALHHGDQAAIVLREVGYDDPVITRVRELLVKKGLASDPQVQLLEDAICLTFLESELASFAAKHDRRKVIDILRKTWAKMTSRGHDAALAAVANLDEKIRSLVLEAIGSG